MHQSIFRYFKTEDEIAEAKCKRLSQGCVINMKCSGPLDIDHVITRGAHGRDAEFYENYMPLCRKHHIEKGSIAYSGMIRKYPQYKNWLENNKRDDVIDRSFKSAISLL